MYKLLCELKGIDPCHVITSAIAQCVWAALWFEFLMRHVYHYYIAADKGVRKVQHIINYYPSWLNTIITFLCMSLRSVIILLLVKVFNGKTFFDYQCAAMCTALAGMLCIHRYFACQRPIQIFIIEQTCEIAVSMIAAAVCYGLHHYGV